MCRLQQEVQRLQAKNQELARQGEAVSGAGERAAAQQVTAEVEQLRATVRPALATCDGISSSSRCSSPLPLFSVMCVHSALCVQVRVQSEQLQVQQGQGAQLQAAQAAHAESAEVIAKMEADMASLSEAYHDLQQAVAAKDSEITALQAGAAIRGDGGSAGGSQLGEMLELRQEMDDLLVCLGQEEEKVEVLSGHLQALGVDAVALIAHIGDEAEGSVDGSAAPAATAADRRVPQPPPGVDVRSWVASAAPTPAPVR